MKSKEFLMILAIFGLTSFFDKSANAEGCKRTVDVYILVTYPSTASEEQIQVKEDKEIQDAANDANAACKEGVSCNSGLECLNSKQAAPGNAPWSAGPIKIVGGSKDPVPQNRQFEKDGVRYEVIGVVKPWQTYRLSPPDNHSPWKRDPQSGIVEDGHVIKLTAPCDCK